MIANTIGLDIQSAFSYVMVREGGGNPQPIGDGIRSWFPSVGSSSDLGSSLLEDATVEQQWGAFIGQPGRHTPVASILPIWKGVYNRLFRYLGYLEPCLANGYETIIASSSVNFSKNQTEIETITRRAGLVDTDVIPATYSLLFRYLADPKVLIESQSARVISVVIGEQSVLVSAFFIEAGRNLYRVGRIGEHIALPGIGYFHWVHDLNRYLNPSGPADTARPLVPWLEAVMEFVGHYNLHGKPKKQTWHGPGAAQLRYLDLVPSWRVEELWEHIPSADELTTLDTSVQTALQSLGGYAADVVLLGGPGAVFPIETRLRSGWPIWRSSQPAMDLAYGSLWWPTFREASPVLRDSLTTLDYRVGTTNSALAAPPTSEPVRFTPTDEADDIPTSWR